MIILLRKMAGKRAGVRRGKRAQMHAVRGIRNETHGDVPTSSNALDMIDTIRDYWNRCTGVRKMIYRTAGRPGRSARLNFALVDFSRYYVMYAVPRKTWAIE